MASLPVRDPVGDHLLTPHNAALAVIVVTAVPRTGRVEHRTAPVSVPICQ
jgi:hypothetical protein